MILRQKNIYIYKYAPDQEKKNLKFFYAPYGLKEYRCKVSTIYLYYYKSFYKLQETSEVLAQSGKYFCMALYAELGKTHFLMEKLVIFWAHSNEIDKINLLFHLSP